MDFPLRIVFDDDFLVALKPSGFPTHRTDVGAKGFVELLEERLAEKLYIVHRLDKDTSGLLLLARSEESSKQIIKLFEEKLVTRKYIFKTQKKLDRDRIKFKTLIEKHSNEMVSIRDQTPNSETLFLKLASEKFGDIWEAQPRTGKTHQIRLHAKDLKIPVDGDRRYDGSHAPRLCLQSQQLEFQWKDSLRNFPAPDPIWIKPVTPFAFPLKESLSRRDFLYQLTGNECYRCVHTENSRYRVDQFGDHWWVYWYDEILPTEEELKELSEIAAGYGKKVWVREMKSRGGAKNEEAKLWNLNEPEKRWQAEELGIKYEFRADQGMSPGLFLDQRINRQWVRRNSKGLKVLNLFSYTGGFSVNAALGGAEKVATVDLSNNFNRWAQQNFVLNGLDPQNPAYQFWGTDTFSFLHKTIKRGEMYDLIICDPPSFGRFDGKVFQIHRDWQTMLDLIKQVLAPAGRILFSTNYERWNYDLFFNKMEIHASKNNMRVEKTPLAGFDFEPPQESPLMKSAFLINLA
ncbi:MAG: class I SAM-dependent methyltransferase [Bdellovibrionota bacterium]